jgi:hypothetical protein
MCFPMNVYACFCPKAASGHAPEAVINLGLKYIGVNQGGAGRQADWGGWEGTAPRSGGILV